MGITGLHHFNIRGNAEDIERVRRFYVDLLGLAEGWRPPFDSGGYWLYAGEEAVLHLVISPRMCGCGPLPADTPGLDHVAFGCDDLGGLLQRLDQHGVEHRLTKVPATGHLQAFLHDPMGNGVELNQAPVRAA